MSRFNQKFEIAGRPVGEGCSVYIVAEAGVAHFGSEEKACRLVDLAADAGADAVKFQVFDVERLISRELPEWRDRLASRQLPYEAFRRIQRYSRQRGITFFATAHDEASFDFLLELGVPVAKIGSGEIGNWPYLRKIGGAGLPVIISTGMYQDEQVAQALDTLLEAGSSDVAVLHCVTRYPVPPAEAALGNIAKLRAKFGAVTGYSDHTKGIHFPLAAIALGARVLEKHITLDFDVPNAQDWKVSCGPTDLPELVRQARELESGAGTREGPTDGERESLAWASKSLVVARDIRAGEAIAAGDLESKRPGTGIPPSALSQVVGRRAKVDLVKDAVLKWEHLR
jgi:N,N'-diacetyllegionaminate synthase